MILDICSEINQRSIILASKSPRRKELLAKLGLHFECVSTDAEENAPKDDPKRCVEENALIKVESVKSSADLIIASDTVVSFKGKIFEKPKNKNEAKEFLEQLSGSWHEVHTSVVLKLKSKTKISFVETTEVEFAKLDKSLIAAYIDSEEPYDKAGAYGIQGTGASFVKQLKGCYFNVMGFPLQRFSAELRKLHKKGVI